MTVGLILVWLVGVVAMIPVAWWWARDLARIPGRVWAWSGHHRNYWQWAVLVGWVAGGWPAMVVVLAWSQSNARAHLLAVAQSETDRHPRPD